MKQFACLRILIKGGSVIEYKVRTHPIFAACGLNCGLCPRFYTAGTSRCPGCAGEGFSEVHPPCGVLTCCGLKGLEFCFFCDEYPCKKYDGCDLLDSFITHKNQLKDMDKAKRIGVEAYIAELSDKVEILEELLKNYDDGRRKSFFCLAVNLLDLADVKLIIKQINNEVLPQASIKEKAAAAVRLFQGMADERGIVLKLRKE